MVSRSIYNNSKSQTIPMNQSYWLHPSERPYGSSAELPNEGRPYIVFDPYYITAGAGAGALHEDRRGTLAIPSNCYFDGTRTVLRRLYFYITEHVLPYSESESPMAGQFVDKVSVEIQAVVMALIGGGSAAIIVVVKYYTVEATVVVEQALWESEEWPLPTTVPAAECVIRDLEEVEVLVVDDSECCICGGLFTPLVILYDEHGDRDLIVLRLPCSHIFHKICIVPWLRISRECPLCRYILPSDDDLRNAT